jgi:ABC-type Fe3+-hydroxamate transport system substrate-binding protein
MRTPLLRNTFFALSFFSFAQGCAYASAPEIRVVDALGDVTSLPRPAQRVIPLLPSLAEVLDRVGVPEVSVVGITEYTDFPLSYRKKPSVGSYAKPNLEQIVALKPDLILAGRDGTPDTTVKRLRKLGMPVVVVATETLAGLRETYPLVGTVMGKSSEAKIALDAFDQEMNAIRSRAKMRAPLKVLIQVGEDPLVVAAGNTFLHEGLEAIGARNIYGDLAKTYPRVSVEDVLVRNPDVIVLIGLGKDLKEFERAKKRWSTFPKLSASKTERIVVLRSDPLVRPGPRFPQGLIDLERAVYGVTP